ncbi:hypothetical protein ABXJ76_05135 [Methylobacter sp. G7]|uniref:hypothetical protein n=1 Tax=Methylobacter sp. G7 TaxID=3230117 RepID=UPI003D808397
MNLHNRFERLKNTFAEGKKTVRFDGYIFAGLMFLSVLGVSIADAFEGLSQWYWVAMVPVFFGACLYLEWQSSLDSGVSAKTIFLKQFQHWLGLLVTFYLTFFLRKIGSLDNQTTGLILLLLLAHSTFLAGITMGWLFRLLGIFLAICLVLVAYMEHFLGFVIGISVLMLLVYRFVVRP